MSSNFSAFLTEEEKDLQRSFQVLKSVRENLNAMKVSRTGEAAKTGKGETSKAQTIQEAKIRTDEMRKKAIDGQITFNPSGENRTTGFKRPTLREKKESEETNNMNKSDGQNIQKRPAHILENDFSNRIPSIRDFKIPKKKPRTEEVPDKNVAEDPFSNSFGIGDSSFGNSSFDSGGSFGNISSNFGSKSFANNITESSNSIELLDKKNNNSDDFGNNSFGNTAFDNSNFSSKQDKEGFDTGNKSDDDPFGNGGFGNGGFGSSGGNSNFGNTEKPAADDPFGNGGFGNGGFGGSELNTSNDSNHGNEHFSAGGGFGQSMDGGGRGRGRGGGGRGQRRDGRGGGRGGGRGICNFFQRNGTCKYGDTCKFSHEAGGNEGDSGGRGGGGNRRGRGGGFGNSGGNGWQGNRDQGNMARQRERQSSGSGGAEGGFRDNSFGAGSSTMNTPGSSGNDGFGNDGFGNSGF